MLQSLNIRNVVLIEALNLGFQGSLSVLTGETGAGKSILLDSLGLVLGDRARTALIRKGADKAIVSAAFDVPAGHPSADLLADQGLDMTDDVLLLRREITKDGKSRAWVNDSPVSITFLRALGDSLVEIHGQHDDRGLLNPAGHRDLLDAFGGLGPDVEAVRAAYRTLTDRQAELEAHEAALVKIAEDEELDRHALEELDALNPVAGEEEELAEARALMMQAEKSTDELASIAKALLGEKSPDDMIRRALRRLERIDGPLGVRLNPVIESLARAIAESEDGLSELQRVIAEAEFEPGALEDAEERLFALRAQARKHNCAVENLPQVREEVAARLENIASGSARTKALKQALAEAHTKYDAVAERLTEKRKKAAAALDKRVMRELPPLKLEKARFQTALHPIGANEISPEGRERVSFMVATNPGTAPGPIVEIASGGELSRFILALKVALAETGSAPTLIFDEVDRGIGGAVADAVGERLAKLSDQHQVLVVTHSPQVAARGAHHWRIEKSGGEATVTAVEGLSPENRREEIARMLSGAEVTDEARAAADSLLRAGDAA